MVARGYQVTIALSKRSASTPTRTRWDPQHIDRRGPDGDRVCGEPGRRTRDDDGERSAGQLAGSVGLEVRRGRGDDTPEDRLSLAEEPGELRLRQGAPDLARQVDRQQVGGQNIDHDIDGHPELDQRVDVGVDARRVPVEVVLVDEECRERCLGREVVVEGGRAEVAGVGERLDRRAAIAVRAEDRRRKAEELVTAALDAGGERGVERQPAHGSPVRAPRVTTTVHLVLSCVSQRNDC